MGQTSTTEGARLDEKQITEGIGDIIKLKCSRIPLLNISVVPWKHWGVSLSGACSRGARRLPAHPIIFQWTTKGGFQPPPRLPLLVSSYIPHPRTLDLAGKRPGGLEEMASPFPNCLSSRSDTRWRQAWRALGCIPPGCSRGLPQTRRHMSNLPAF